ncbi:hypothetical protein WN944_014561 [Citrus x changshan-huyou]|uniref:Uncharacterized protein n=1 Tax=Citrus x changshan-huyou TaxID=2935761 RepID=A0AAP0QLT2_9ROSI
MERVFTSTGKTSPPPPPDYKSPPPPPPACEPAPPPTPIFPSPPPPVPIPKFTPPPPHPYVYASPPPPYYYQKAAMNSSCFLAPRSRSATTTPFGSPSVTTTLIRSRTVTNHLPGYDSGLICT